MTEYFSKILNACRWLAAFVVVISHARHLTLASYSEVVDRTFWVKGLYFVTGLGHEAVLIFFVVSGLLVGGMTIRRSTVTFDLRSYVLSRASRIYSVLFLALALGWVLDRIGLSFFNGSLLYTNSAMYKTSSMDFAIAGRLDIGTFVGNLLSLQTIVVDPLGSNGPLWSLAYEVWYYIIFAGVAVVYYRPNPWVRFTGLTLVVLSLVFLPNEILLWSLIWALGIGVYWYGNSSLPKPARWVGVSIFVVALVLTRLGHSSEGASIPDSMWLKLSRDFLLAAAFAVFLLSFWGRSGSSTGARLHAWLASFSFSTYLIHFPVYVFVSAMAHDLFNQKLTRQPSAAAILFMVAAVTVVCGFAYVFSLVTERRTGAVREFLSDRWTARWA